MSSSLVRRFIHRRFTLTSQLKTTSLINEETINKLPTPTNLLHRSTALQAQPIQTPIHRQNVTRMINLRPLENRLRRLAVHRATIQLHQRQVNPIGPENNHRSRLSHRLLQKEDLADLLAPKMSPKSQQPQLRQQRPVKTSFIESPAMARKILRTPTRMIRTPDLLGLSRWLVRLFILISNSQTQTWPPTSNWVTFTFARRRRPSRRPWLRPALGLCTSDMDPESPNPADSRSSRSSQKFTNSRKTTGPSPRFINTAPPKPATDRKKS